MPSLKSIRYDIDLDKVRKCGLLCVEFYRHQCRTSLCGMPFTATGIHESSFAAKTGATVSIAAGAMMLFLSVAGGMKSGEIAMPALFGAIGAFSISTGAFAFNLDSSNKKTLRELLELAEERLAFLEKVNQKVSKIVSSGLSQENRFLISQLLLERSSNLETSLSTLEDLRKELERSKKIDGALQVAKWPIYLVGAAGVIVGAHGFLGRPDGFGLNRVFGVLGFGVSLLTIPGMSALAHFSAKDVELLEKRIEILRQSIEERKLYIERLRTVL